MLQSRAVEEGFQLLVVGMGTVFAFLTLLVLLMTASGWVFRQLGPEEEPAPPPASRTTGVTAASAASEEAEIAAVLAAAEAYRRRRGG